MQIKDEYKKSPFVLWRSEKAYAIGGDVKLNDNPPKLGRTISECTDAEYKLLYKLGYTRFFQEETVKTKATKKQKEDAPVPAPELGNVEQPIEDDNAIASDI